jgi:hypothetical protein
MEFPPTGMERVSLSPDVLIVEF